MSEQETCWCGQPGWWVMNRGYRCREHMIETRRKEAMPEDILARLESDFTYHPPKEGQPQRYEALRAAAKQLARMIVDSTPASREQSLALTNLEQAIFWANASIARHE